MKEIPLVLLGSVADCCLSQGLTIWQSIIHIWQLWITQMIQ